VVSLEARIVGAVTHGPLIAHEVDRQCLLFCRIPFMVLPEEEGTRSRHLSFIEGFTVKRTEQVVLNVEFVRREADAAAHRISCHGDVERVKELKRDIARMVLQHEVTHLLAVVIFGGGWQTPRDEPWFSESGEAMVTRPYNVCSLLCLQLRSVVGWFLIFFSFGVQPAGLERPRPSPQDVDRTDGLGSAAAAVATRGCVHLGIPSHGTTTALCPAPGMAAL